MKLNKYLIIIILLNLCLISINANEKPIILNENLEEVFNNEIDTLFCFSFKIDKFINSKNTSLLTREDYLRKANGFLAMGIIGLIVTSLSLPASAGLTIMLWYIAPVINHNIIVFFAGPLLFLISFLAIGIPILVTGFIFYRFYIKQKIPDPFIDENKNNEIVILKFCFEKPGG